MSGLINIYDCLSIAVRLRLYSALDLCFRLYHDRCAASREIAFSLENSFAHWAAASSARLLDDLKLERSLPLPYAILRHSRKIVLNRRMASLSPVGCAGKLLGHRITDPVTALPFLTGLRLLVSRIQCEATKYVRTFETAPFLF